MMHPAPESRMTRRRRDDSYYYDNMNYNNSGPTPTCPSVKDLITNIARLWSVQDEEEDLDQPMTRGRAQSRDDSVYLGDADYASNDGDSGYGPSYGGVERSKSWAMIDTTAHADRMKKSGIDGLDSDDEENDDKSIVSRGGSLRPPGSSHHSRTSKGAMEVSVHQQRTQERLAAAVFSYPMSLRDFFKEAQETQAQRQRRERLVLDIVDCLAQRLRQVIARRQTLERRGDGAADGPVQLVPFNSHKVKYGTVLDEFTEIIRLPDFDEKDFDDYIDPDTIILDRKVLIQLKRYVTVVASMYRNNPFHNFEHASHVTMSANKLLQRVVKPLQTIRRYMSLQRCGTSLQKQIAADLHNYTFGIATDPLTQFAIVYSALIHDVDHFGVSNMQLAKEKNPIAEKYKNKSVLEQNSVDLAWGLLMESDYAELQKCIFPTDNDFKRFRQVVVNVVMGTDIFDAELSALRKKRWEQAFSKKPDPPKEEPKPAAAAVSVVEIDDDDEESESDEKGETEEKNEDKASDDAKPAAHDDDAKEDDEAKSVEGKKNTSDPETSDTEDDTVPESEAGGDAEETDGAAGTLLDPVDSTDEAEGDSDKENKTNLADGEEKKEIDEGDDDDLKPKATNDSDAKAKEANPAEDGAVASPTEDGAEGDAAEEDGAKALSEEEQAKLDAEAAAEAEAQAKAAAEAKAKAEAEAEAERLKAMEIAEAEHVKATVVIEHIMQAADVAHTMQDWHIYQKWNRRLFDELYTAYKQGRMGVDPCSFWYEGEMKFFDGYIIPLAKKLQECGVFGVASDECLNRAMFNRKEWEVKGKKILDGLIENYEIREKEEAATTTKTDRRSRVSRRRSLVTTTGA